MIQVLVDDVQYNLKAKPRAMWNVSEGRTSETLPCLMRTEQIFNELLEIHCMFLLTLSRLKEKPESHLLKSGNILEVL